MTHNQFNWLLVALVIAMVTLPEPWNNIAMWLIVIGLGIVLVRWRKRGKAA